MAVNPPDWPRATRSGDIAVVHDEVKVTGSQERLAQAEVRLDSQQGTRFKVT